MDTSSVAALCRFCHQKIPSAQHIRRNLTGQQYGRLSVNHFAFQRRGQSYWCCVCLCHATTIVAGYSLYGGNTQSCGCLKRERLEELREQHIIHGMTGTNLYARWVSMIMRCDNPSYHAYPDYGARGITVCERWRQSFVAWLEDMGEPPPGMHLERRNNDGPYNPENCYWATRLQQANNKRNNHVIVYGDERYTLAQWARMTHIPASTLQRRLARGWDIEEAITTPLDMRYSHPRTRR